MRSKDEPELQWQPPVPRSAFVPFHTPSNSRGTRVTKVFSQQEDLPHREKLHVRSEI